MVSSLVETIQQYVNEIQYITISTLGDASDFGDMTRTENNVSGAGSATRLVLAGGYDNSTRTNTMDYVTIINDRKCFLMTLVI